MSQQGAVLRRANRPTGISLQFDGRMSDVLVEVARLEHVGDLSQHLVDVVSEVLNLIGRLMLDWAVLATRFAVSPLIECGRGNCGRRFVVGLVPNRFRLP